jgi:hypothetical protein
MADNRKSWLDDETQAPLINQYTEQLTSFIDSLADGRIEDAELAAQEARLQKAMQAVEPQLSDALHADVTRLLCELTAYNIMHTLYDLQKARPMSTFHG